MSMLKSRALQISLPFYPNSSKVGNYLYLWVYTSVQLGNSGVYSVVKHQSSCLGIEYCENSIILAKLSEKLLASIMLRGKLLNLMLKTVFALSTNFFDAVLKTRLTQEQ